VAITLRCKAHDGAPFVLGCFG